MRQSAQEVHAKAEHAREAGEFLEALRLSDEALLAYQTEKNVLGIGDILASRSITFRLLWEQTNDQTFLILAKHEVMAGVEIARAGEKADVIMPLFRLGQVQDELGEFKDAVKSYSEAIEIFGVNPPKEHNRKGVLADMQVRLGVSQYRNGDKSALSKILEAIKDLEESDEKTVSKYNYDVWLSGAHMKVGEILKSDDPEEARKHLKVAKEIIDGNSDLKLRKRQWEKLNAGF